MYFLAIVLPKDLNEKVLKYKHIMQQKYNCRVGLKSPAHITLVPPFWMEQNKEQHLLRDIDLISSRYSPFIIVTDNFSAFKLKTIFIALAPNKHLDEVKAATDNFFMNNLFYSIKTDTRSFHPHITIATRDLFKKDFFEIWPWFESQKFFEEWKAEGIAVLRHNKKNWDVIHTSQFKQQDFILEVE